MRGCVLLYGTNSCFPLGHADVQLLQAVELSLDVADSWTKLHAYGIRSILVEGEDPFIKIGETIVQIAFWPLELARTFHGGLHDRRFAALGGIRAGVSRIQGSALNSPRQLIKA